MKYQRQPYLVGIMRVSFVMLIVMICMFIWAASKIPSTVPVIFIAYGIILLGVVEIVTGIPIYNQCFWLIEFSPQGVRETTKRGVEKKFLSWEDCKEIGLVTYNGGSNVLIYFSPKVLCPMPKSAPRRIPKEAIILAYSKEAIQDLLQYIPKAQIHNHHIIDQIAQYEADHPRKKSKRN